VVVKSCVCPVIELTAGSARGVSGVRWWERTPTGECRRVTGFTGGLAFNNNELTRGERIEG
jgi:hypothetical protein